MRTVDVNEALYLLRKAVDLKGADYVYERSGTPMRGSRCLYFDPDTEGPSCIVGHVLAWEGVTYCDLDEAGANEQTVVLDVDLRRYGLQLSPLAEIALEVAQAAQDFGRPWGDAFARASQRVALARLEGMDR